MGRDLVLLAAGGVLAGFLFGSTAVAGSFVAMLLVYFSSLPLFLVALSLGVFCGLGAAAIGAVTVVFLGGPPAGGIFAVAVASPALLVSYRALLNRPDGQGGTEWYPPGGLLAMLCGAIAAAMLCWIAIMLGEGGDPRLFLQRTIETVIGTAFRTGAPGVPVGGAEVASNLAADIAAVLPGMAASMFLVAHAASGILAQRLAMRLDIARRPTPAWSELTLPAWPTFALGIACLGGIAGEGLLEYIARNLAIVFAVPFLLQGMAVIHSVAAGFRARRVLLVGFYLMVAFTGWLALPVVGLGLAEPYIRLRERFDLRRKGKG